MWAYDEAVDYGALYAADYAAQQLAPLRDRTQYPLLALLPPYAKFFQRLGPGHGRLLLDFGCGAGRFLLAAQGRGWQVQGIEPAQSAVDAAVGLGLAVSTATPQALRAGGAQFDVITAFDVLEHLASPVDTLIGLLPLLRPGGTLFATVPNWASPLMQQTARPDWLPPVHLQFFTEHSLRLCLHYAEPELRVVGSGVLSSDPAPPLSQVWNGRARSLAGPWLRWLSRRLRGQRLHQPQLWVEGRSRLSAVME
jgi:2-polyprenyl-3-methyl-5-hydroxy-6-metoxy-1,4-benzoquinol methylase